MVIQCQVILLTHAPRLASSSNTRYEKFRKRKSFSVPPLLRARKKIRLEANGSFGLLGPYAHNPARRPPCTARRPRMVFCAEQRTYSTLVRAARASLTPVSGKWQRAPLEAEGEQQHEPVAGMATLPLGKWSRTSFSIGGSRPRRRDSSRKPPAGGFASSSPASDGRRAAAGVCAATGAAARRASRSTRDRRRLARRAAAEVTALRPAEQRDPPRKKIRLEATAMGGDEP